MIQTNKPSILIKKVSHRNNIPLLLVFNYDESLKNTSFMGWQIKREKTDIF